MKQNQSGHLSKKKQHLSIFGRKPIKTIYKREILWLSPVFLFSFILTFNNGFQNSKLNLYGVANNLSYPVARKIFGGLDAGSYLDGALQIMKLEHSTNLNSFVWLNWPPGMPVVFALFGHMNWFFQHALMSGVFLQAFSTAGIMTLLSFFLLRHGNPFLLVLPWFLILFSPYSDWVLKYGLMYGEGPGLFFLALSISCLAVAGINSEKSSHQEPKKLRRMFILGGTFLGMSAYFRSPIDSIFTFSLIIYLIFLAVIFIKNRKIPVVERSFSFYFLGYILTTLPWRIFAKIHFSIPFYRWTTLGSDFSGAYVKDQNLIDGHAEAWAHGNLNWVCHLQLEKCGQAGTHSMFALLEAALNNLGPFLKLRFGQLWQFAGLHNGYLYPGSVFTVQSFVWIFCFVLSVAISLKVLIMNSFSPLWFMLLLTSVSQLLVIFLTHFESRYLLPITINMIFVFCFYYLKLYNPKQIAIKR